MGASESQSHWPTHALNNRWNTPTPFVLGALPDLGTGHQPLRQLRTCIVFSHPHYLLFTTTTH